MPDILVRNLEPATVEELRARAKRNNRSVQAEVKSILEDATRSRAAAFERLVQHSDAIRNSLRDTHVGDSTDLIREDRDR